MKTTPSAPSLLIPCLLVVMNQPVVAHNDRRQITLQPQPPLSGTDTSTTVLPSTTSNVVTTTSNTQAATTTTTAAATATSANPPSASSAPPTLSQPSAPSTPSNTISSPPTTASDTSLPSISSPPTLTNGGSTVFVTSTDPFSSSTSSSSSAAPPKASDDSGGDSSLGTGSIIGISVAGGVAVIAIIAFIVWKFTRKRFADLEHNEAIKWPELNTHGGNQDSHPLPVHNTGRSGFDTGSEASLSRVPSTSNYSTPELGGDPYAVPPLPHMNPNQPYRDDPAAATGYYDPYRGPIPGTIEHGAVDDYAGEAIPMTQMGRSSPGPQAVYGGRGSPGPQAAYGGRGSPGPQVAYGGRTSPGPHAAYDLYGAR